MKLNIAKELLEEKFNIDEEAHEIKVTKIKIQYPYILSGPNLLK